MLCTYINCSECQNKNKKQFMYTTCSELIVFMYWTGKSMNNLLWYCELVDERIWSNNKDLPVQMPIWHLFELLFKYCKAMKSYIIYMALKYWSQLYVSVLKIRKNAKLPKKLSLTWCLLKKNLLSKWKTKALQIRHTFTDRNSVEAKHF